MSEQKQLTADEAQRIITQEKVERANAAMQEIMAILQKHDCKLILVETLINGEKVRAEFQAVPK